MRRLERSLVCSVIAVMGLAVMGCPPAEPPPEEPPAVEPVPDEAPPAPPMELPPGVTQEMVSQGQALFTGQGGCYACHGMDARGTQLGPNLTDGEWLNVPEPTMDHIEAIIRTGVAQPRQYPAPMPPMGGVSLTDEQVDALTAYVYTIGHQN